ncbi:MAG TPA: galactose-1-phosphate uridylyltransferase [Acidimicrobiia bacterium]|nr:galactose-1-phosphate uridylyltransferase [Acidimicrobiia bacterium]
MTASDGELRRDALTGEWVTIVGARQDRPHLPDGPCPFCVGGLEAPEPYTVRAFPNRWPPLTGGAALDDATGLDRTPARGAAEIVLYTPDHDASFASLGVAAAHGVVDLWAERTAALLARLDVAYVLVLENRGREVGATIDHPHGQIYGFPFVPPVPAREAARSAEQGCVICGELGRERTDPARVVHDADGWLGWVPFAAGWPFGLLVAPLEHVPGLPELSDEGRVGLAGALVDVLGRYDRLFGRPVPYMLWVHQQPGVIDAHLHVHVAPTWRAASVTRYVAAAELGSGTLFNPVVPEDAAARLRQA